MTTRASTTDGALAPLDPATLRPGQVVSTAWLGAVVVGGPFTLLRSHLLRRYRLSPEPHDPSNRGHRAHGILIVEDVPGAPPPLDPEVVVAMVEPAHLGEPTISLEVLPQLDEEGGVAVRGGPVPRWPLGREEDLRVALLPSPSRSTTPACCGMR